ncbi:MAG: transaldolase family protein [Acidimicrobiales bacterium]
MNYFSRLVAETPSRVWVNNPTIEEVELALAQGATGCTTNPAFAGGLLKRVPDEVKPVVSAAISAYPGAPALEVADVVQRKLVAPVVARFQPMFDDTKGKAGFVSIQGPPEADTDVESIWGAAETNHALGPNATPKIPATLPGFDALDRVVESGWPVIVTEVFSLDQLETACERYLTVTERTGFRPPFLLAPITGIFGDHLKKLAQQQGLAFPAHELELAGVYLARRCASLVAQRGYPVTLLFGGARNVEDLTGLVGAAHCATINWSTFADVLSLGPPLEHTIDRPPVAEVVEHLLATFPDFWHSWELGRLAPEQFEEFGPVLHFRDNFISGWRAVEAEVESQRS